MSALSLRTFVSCLAQLPFWGLTVRTLGYKRACTLIRDEDSKTSVQLSSVKKAQVLEEVQTGFNTALKYSPYRGTCLSRSLLLKTLLRQQGVVANLCIGVSTAENNFRAHAWLESDGLTLRHDKGQSTNFVTLKTP